MWWYLTPYGYSSLFFPKSCHQPNVTIGLGEIVNLIKSIERVEGKIDKLVEEVEQIKRNLP